MNSQTIVMCVVLFLLGMLLANMLKSVCGCKVVEGQASKVFRPRPEGGQYCGQDGDLLSLSDTDKHKCIDNHDAVFAACNVAKFSDDCDDDLLDETYRVCGCKWDDRMAPPGMCRAIDRDNARALSVL